MAGVFDINIDNLDFTKIRMNVKSTTATNNTQDSREARTKTDLLQSVRRNTLISFAQLCRIFNIDALHPASLQLTILLMSKCTDRKYLCANFTSSVADINMDIEIDENAATMIDRAEHNTLHSTSDWVTLFSYIYVATLSESERTALQENPRVAIFMHAMRPIFKENTDVETIIVPMLCTILMHIPAASMLERVLIAQGQQHRDIEVMCLRGVNSYVDQCQHLSNDSTLQAILMLVRAIRVKADFQADIASIIDLSVQDGSESSETMKRKFSLRRHIKEQDHGTVEHRAMLFERWQYEMKFSVNVSLAMQKFLYFLHAQTFHLDVSVLKSLVEPQMLAKTMSVKLERIDADVVCAVIKTLRVYQGNIESLLDFRSTCLVKTLNAKLRSKLTPSVVLQLYVACWQHPSIREHCWRSVLNVSNFAITKSCEAFRVKYKYEQLSVLQTLLHCHTENRKTSDLLSDGNT